MFKGVETAHLVPQDGQCLTYPCDEFANIACTLHGIDPPSEKSRSGLCRLLAAFVADSFHLARMTSS